jgi:hypothetical protein
MSLWEAFTCDDCGTAARRPRTPDEALTPRRCWCCRLLDTVQDVELRAALRAVLAPEGGSAAEPGADCRFDDRADAPGGAWPRRR